MGSLTLGIELLLQNQKKKASVFLPSLKTVNQNIIPGGITEIIATIRDLRYARTVITSTSPLIVMFSQKPAGLWRMTVEDQ